MSHVIIIASLLSTGCVAVRNGDTTHYIVIGFGVVSVNNTNKAVAQVVRTSTLGLVAGERRIGIGLSSYTTVSVNTNENFLVEVKRTPGKLTVTSPTYEITPQHKR